MSPLLLQEPPHHSDRKFIGSPPPSALKKKTDEEGSSRELLSTDTWRKPEEEESGEEEVILDEEEVTAYSPTPSLEQSYPKITIKKAPLDDDEEGEDSSPQLQDNAIVNVSPSKSSGRVSMNSLIQSTSSLNLNSSLSLPPKLVSYVAEDGSTAVQVGSSNPFFSRILQRFLFRL